MPGRPQAKAFINETRDNKLESENFGDTQKRLHGDKNFLLMKSVTTGEWILKVIIRKGTEIPHLKRLETRAVSIVHVPVDGGWTPQDIRDKLLEKLVL